MISHMRCPLSLPYVVGTRILRVSDLAQCDEPLIFDVSVHNLVDNANTQISIRACSQVDSITQRTLKARQEMAIVSTDDNCGAKLKHATLKAQISASSGGSSVIELSSEHVGTAVSQLVTSLRRAAT